MEVEKREDDKWFSSSLFNSALLSVALKGRKKERKKERKKGKKKGRKRNDGITLVKSLEND